MVQSTQKTPFFDFQRISAALTSSRKTLVDLFQKVTSGKPREMRSDRLIQTTTDVPQQAQATLQKAIQTEQQSVFNAMRRAFDEHLANLMCLHYQKKGESIERAFDEHLANLMCLHYQKKGESIEFATALTTVRAIYEKFQSLHQAAAKNLTPFEEHQSNLQIAWQICKELDPNDKGLPFVFDIVLRPNNTQLSEKNIKYASCCCIAHSICRQSKKNGVSITFQTAFELATHIASKESTPLKKLSAEAQQFSESHPDIIAKAKEIELPIYSTRSYQELQKTLAELKELLQTTPENMALANKQALTLIRKAVSTDAYKLLCHDESIPEIQCLHRMIMASYTVPKPLESYSSLKETLELSEQSTFTDSLENSRATGLKKGLLVAEKVVSYILSTGLGMLYNQLKANWFIPGRFDARMQGNMPGVLHEEQRGPWKTTLLYTPSPTIGTEAAPEAKAFLQAMENRHFMTPGVLAQEPDYAQYTQWTFANLQDLQHPSEGLRAKAVMQLNEEFPFSFTGISLALDSPFYLDGIHGADMEKIKQQKIANAGDGLTEEYKQQMEEELKTPAYSFPDSDTWSKSRKAIIDTAFAQIMKQEMAQTLSEEEQKIWKWNQKAAFRELVYLGILRHWQQTSSPLQGNSLVSACCKECIDRGGKMTSELFWGLGGKEEEVLLSVHSRPLSARKRLPIPFRLEPFIALSKFTSQKDLTDFLSKIQ